MITIYTTKDCFSCPKICNYLKGRNIPYIEKQATKFPQECMYYNISSVPAVRIDDDVCIIGNDISKLVDFLEQHNGQD